MKVQIKVRVNADAINEAKSKNDYYSQQREKNKTIKHSKERMLVPDDVVVPEAEVELCDVLIDVKDVLWARRNEIGMISIIHLGKELMIVDTPEVWEQLEKRFEV
jgi:hypothetical protein